MSQRTRIILVVIAALLLSILFFFFFIRPRQAEIAELDTEISAAQARTQQLTAELQRLQDLQARAPQLRAELAEIREFVPTQHEIPNFIFLVQAASNAAGIDFLTIAPSLPGGTPEGAAVAQIEIPITATGTYFSIQDFIRRLHTLDRAVRLDTFNLGVTEEGGLARLAFSGTLRIFFEIPAVPVPEPEAGAEVSPEPTPTEAA